ncbi:MAG TPA: cell division protein DivIVA [Actinomycetota bacterium]|nr:cell division protein DivIVA [Actinomycetota bacterium]
MSWVFALLALGLVVAFGLVLAGRLPAVPQPTAQRYAQRLPERPSAADVDLLRLPVVLRGYRMDDTDAALAVLRDRIAELEAARLPTAGPVRPGADVVSDQAGEQVSLDNAEPRPSPFAPPGPDGG